MAKMTAIEKLRNPKGSEEYIKGWNKALKMLEKHLGTKIEELEGALEELNQFQEHHDGSYYDTVGFDGDGDSDS